MIKISKVNTLKKLKHVKIYKAIREMRMKNFINTYGENFRSSLTFICNKYKNKFVILHESTRDNFKYQLSYFDNKGAIMDERYNDYMEAIEKMIRLNSYKIKEV